MKVMTIVGTRPELIKLSRVIYELDKHCQQILIHTGQNYDFELNEIFFRDLGIRKPDCFMDAAGSSVAETIANVIRRSDDLFQLHNPDALLVLGDTNSCLSVISAKRRKIPIFHMEAGNRCFDLSVPEEINRKIVDHVSDINLTYTEHARLNLLAEGIRPEVVMKTGSPMKEILDYYSDRIDASEVLRQLNLQQGQYFVVSAHREENVDNLENLAALLKTLKMLVLEYGIPVIVSTHPRTRMRMVEADLKMNDDRIHFLKPLGFFDYIKLQKNSMCVLSDSGTLTEESSILGFPAVTLRQVHERPEGMDQGTLIMCGLGSYQVMQALKTVISQVKEKPFEVVPDYLTTDVSRKVVRIIMSYVGYINRVNWHKIPSLQE